MSSNYATLECERCGDAYTRHESQEDTSRYCSSDCQHARDTVVSSEEMASYDDPEWEENRQAALARDGRTCQCCYKDHTDDVTLAVHHVLPVSHGGSHDLRNLSTLCQSCHASIHASGNIITSTPDRGLLYPRERELLANEVPVDIPKDDIFHAFRRDVRFLKQHAQELFDELGDIVCENSEENAAD